MSQRTFTATRTLTAAVETAVRQVNTQLKPPDLSLAKGKRRWTVSGPVIGQWVVSRPAWWVQTSLHLSPPTGIP